VVPKEIILNPDEIQAGTGTGTETETNSLVIWGFYK
jgi:hypothetical protein